MRGMIFFLRRDAGLMSLRMVVFLLGVLFAGCSTTSRLPEEEQLYIGMEDIVYEDSPEMKLRALEKGEDGVIKSIGRAVETVDQLLTGVQTANEDSVEEGGSREELKQQLKEKIKAETEDFALAQEEIEAVLAYPPNYALLGSSSLRSPFPVGLWVYNHFFDSKGGFGKWMFKHFSATPVFVSTVSPEMRARVATNTLHNYGYFRGKVDFEVKTQKNPRQAKVAYHVYAGPLSRLDSVAYLNFSVQVDSLLKRTEHRRLLHKGDAFSVVNLANEQARVEKLLRENGYFYYAAPYLTYRADTLQRSNYVQLQVMPAVDMPVNAQKQWYMGNTIVSVRHHERDVLDKTLQLRHYTYHYSGKKIPLRPGMWMRSISHRKGELYRLTHQEMTLEKLNALGVFSQMDVSYVPRDTTASCDTLDVYVTALMDKLYDSSFEMNATFKSNQQVGPGVSFGLAKRNAFGGGEKVSFNIFGSYEWQTGAGSAGGNSLLNSYEVGTELAFDFPRVVFPGIGRRHFRFPATTTFAINADWRNRAGFFNMVNLGLDATYQWHLNRSSQHELTLLGLDFDKMLHTTASFDSIMQANPALHMSMRDQFIPSISYTYTYASAARHRNPVWLQVMLKEAGNLVSGIYAISGKKMNQRDKELFGNPFAQFIKATAEFRETFRLSRRYQIAGRVFAGLIYSYGNATRAPYSEQFYVGGANSVRGFTVRTIGPGTYRSQDSKYAYIDQTGDFKLEANVEFRAQLFGSLHGAVFFDAGNVWLLREDPARPGAALNKENIRKWAVSTGLGFRYDLDFLVLRLDIGVPLHAPYETGKSGWYNIPSFGKNLAWHFAIGYPF